MEEGGCRPPLPGAEMAGAGLLEMGGRCSARTGRWGLPGVQQLFPGPVFSDGTKAERH